MTWAQVAILTTDLKCFQYVLNYLVNGPVFVYYAALVREPTI